MRPCYAEIGFQKRAAVEKWDGRLRGTIPAKRNTDFLFCVFFSFYIGRQGMNANFG